MLAVLNLGVLFRETSVVMIKSTLQLVPHIYHGTMHGQLPHDVVLTFPLSSQLFVTRPIAVAAHHNVAVYHPSILGARTVTVLGNTASHKHISNSLIS